MLGIDNFRSNVRKEYQIVKFLSRLFDVVSSCNSGAIHWNDNGLCAILNQDKFENEYLKSNSYFQQVSCEEFLSDLVILGFTKSLLILDAVINFEIKHALFKRGHKNLVPQIIENAKCSESLLIESVKTEDKSRAAKRESRANKDSSSTVVKSRKLFLGRSNSGKNSSSVKKTMKNVRKRGNTDEITLSRNRSHPLKLGSDIEDHGEKKSTSVDPTLARFILEGTFLICDQSAESSTMIQNDELSTNRPIYNDFNLVGATKIYDLPTSTNAFPYLLKTHECLNETIIIPILACDDTANINEARMVVSYPIFITAVYDE